MFKDLIIRDLPSLPPARHRQPPELYPEPDWFEPPLHQRARMWNQLVRTATVLPADALRIDLRTATEIERDGEHPSAVMRPFALPLSQWEPAPHRKIAHPYGVVALAVLVGDKDSNGTGVFAPFAKTPVLLRMSLAHPFFGHHPAQIGVAMKFFRWRTHPGHLFCNNPYTALALTSSRRRDHWFGRAEREERALQLRKALSAVFTSALPDPRSTGCREKFTSQTALEEIAKGVTAFDVAVEALGSPAGVRATRLSHRDICSRNVDTVYSRPYIPYSVELKFDKWPTPSDVDPASHDLRCILTKSTEQIPLDTALGGARFATLTMRDRREACPAPAAHLKLQSRFIASQDGDLRLRFPHPSAPDSDELFDRSVGCPGHLAVCGITPARRTEA
jgi:hypothetical protein